jgi:hypothetical protein
MIDRIAYKAVEVELQTNGILHVNVDGMCEFRVRCIDIPVALRCGPTEEEILYHEVNEES